jgi:hypothetical protein
MLHTERIGNQTQLTARLRPSEAGTHVAEFRILCDRLETKPTGDVHASGRVTVVGAGFRASCERLTLPLQHARLLFEDQVQLVHDGQLESYLRGDRIAWELPTPAVPPAVLGKPN